MDQQLYRNILFVDDVIHSVWSTLQRGDVEACSDTLNFRPLFVQKRRVARLANMRNTTR
ncbi:hypothetical protein DPMN_172570 [Dreissena polymorpha]|uniref:Uncharacterized protein n=1 Tax=Dreissena polymorpha TaxID=45954 RepID=A0A9D4E3X2_DREPO|nr:hypothetical protein DPMN_172570 [Dreissena polymorpha]